MRRNGHQSGGSNSLDQMFRQMFAPPSAAATMPPPPPPTPMTQVIHTLEEFMYQYNRNIRDYNHNIRLLTQQLDNFTRDSGRRRRPSMTQQYMFSFEPLPHQQDEPAAAPLLAEADLLQRVRMTTFRGGPESADTTCPISLERFREGDGVCEIVGCGHQFKREPALHWLRRNPVCPVCRYDLRTGNVPSPATDAVPPPSTTSNILQQILENLNGNGGGPVVNNITENLNSFLSRDISGGGSQLLYEFEMPLEMLAQSLRNRYSSRDEDDDLDDQPVD